MINKKCKNNNKNYKNKEYKMNYEINYNNK